MDCGFETTEDIRFESSPGLSGRADDELHTSQEAERSTEGWSDGDKR